MNKECELCKKLFEKNPNVSLRMWGKTRYCSISCSKKGKTSWNKGLPRTWESSGSFKKGSKPWNKGNGEYAKKLGFGKWMIGRNGELNGAWKGDDVGYGALHDWVRSNKGSPMKCSSCGKASRTPQMIHWANVSGQYKRDLNDWIRLCAKCHKEYDKGRKQKKFKR